MSKGKINKIASKETEICKIRMIHGATLMDINGKEISVHTFEPEEIELWI